MKFNGLALAGLLMLLSPVSHVEDTADIGISVIPIFPEVVVDTMSVVASTDTVVTSTDTD